MSSSNNGADHAELPGAIFAGDFNAGKSALINALIRREILFSARQESHTLPAFVGASSQATPSYAAMTGSGGPVTAKTHDAFLGTRRDGNTGMAHNAVAARVPGNPFGSLLLVDTAGTSTDTCKTVDYGHLTAPEKTLLILVTDIEYWSARHNMDAIAAHQETFGENLIVLANKADHLNAREIRRITEKAPQRMGDYGISPTPRFFALSARLESARREANNEYRNRTKPAVREACDAAFDAFRIALYEFEAAHAPGIQTFEQMLHTRLASSLSEIPEESSHEV